MRILALLFGLVGVAGSGFLGMKWMGDANKSKETIALAKKLNEVIQDEEQARKLQDLDRAVNTSYALIGGAVLGLVGIVIMLSGNGKLAGLVFLVAFGVSVAIYKDPKIVIFTFGLGLAAVCAILAKPKMAHSRVRQAEARDD